ncbi:MAG: hypothetical protein M0036_20050 [Desulfobacteraceae bacterium]|nr:hypothetical protein [Desulfobacteraceae bacterium]
MSPSVNARTNLLKQMYTLYEDFSSRYPLVCRKGCDLCCTANVTMTSLEGLLILNHWEGQGLTPPQTALQAAVQSKRFQPSLTINVIAFLCLQNKDIPEEAADPAAGPCPLLHNGCCTIYAVRPFGCRAMVSRSQCVRGGAAEIPDEVLSANHLLMQFIEAIDVPGLSGNLTDMLLLLCDAQLRGQAESGTGIAPPQGMAANQPIPVLMVPPEHRARLQPLIRAVQECIVSQRRQR